MTTLHQAYEEGANALVQNIDFGIPAAIDLTLYKNPYPKDENAGWTLFEPSDDLDCRALDGREAKLVHEDGGELTFTLHRDPEALAADTPYDWDAPRHAGVLFTAAWFGYDGWKMYLKGALPTKRVTADTLEPGDIVNLHSEDTGETWEHAVCVAPGKIAVATNNHTQVLHENLEKIIVTTHIGQHPAYKEEA